MFILGLIASLIFSEPHAYQNDRVRFSQEETFFICKKSCPVPLNLTPKLKKEGNAPIGERPPIPKTVGPIKTSILFKSGSATMEGPSLLMLDVMVGTLKQVDLNQVHMKITGFTDAEGDLEVNELLSWKRAEAVAGYFKEQGFHPEKMVLDGKPLCCYRASNETPEGRERNRRAEIYVEVMGKETARPMDP